MVFSRLVRGCSLAVLILSSFLLLDATAISAQTASAGAKKPNIVVIFGDEWKLLFLVQRAHGFDVWQEPFVSLRVPMLVDSHADPFERAEDEAADYAHWRIDRVYLLVPAQAFVGQWLQSFNEFPPRQSRRASA